MTKTWVPPSREEILESLRVADSPLTPQELAERLGVTSRNFPILEKRILAMERDGQLLPNRKGVLLLATRLELVAGRITGHRDGFGFLIPDAGGPDLFLSPRTASARRAHLDVGRRAALRDQPVCVPA